MADRRIRIAKDKVQLVKELSVQEGGKGFFRHMVDILAFSAALGYARNNRSPLNEPAKVPDPIRHSVFQTHGYDTIINLLAVSDSEDPGILANRDDMEDKRAAIFEEYANGGLEILDRELKGAIDYLDTTLLLIAGERSRNEEETESGFDLTKLME